MTTPSRVFIFIFALSFEGAHAIGRIGNNDLVPGHFGEIEDTTEGFVAAVPDLFPTLIPNTDGTATLSAEDPFNTGSDTQYRDTQHPQPTRLSMLAYPFAAAYPSLLTASEQDMTRYLQTQFQFIVTEVSRATCSFFLLGENSVGYVGIAKWGSAGHGYVLTVQKTSSEIGKAGILQILRSTLVNQPCAPSNR